MEEKRIMIAKNGRIRKEERMENEIKRKKIFSHKSQKERIF